ncbi:MAG: ACT domain-containing protein [Lentisphaerae bacterium]|nr:ACT domain-containing protein [Lentisphaerota bacterium]
MIRKQFTLYLENKPGVLASISRLLATAKVNIDGISAYSSADVGLVQVVVSNAAATRKALNRAGIPFTAQDVVLVTLPNEIGSLAAMASKLSRSGVNINYIYATGCTCTHGCRCNVIVSAPDLKKVEKVWKMAEKEL